MATRSDAATLVRCAATCRAARRRVAEDTVLPGRLRRLRDTGRFLLPLLRGHLASFLTSENGRLKSAVHLVDTTAADTGRLVEVTSATAAAEAEAFTNELLLDSRGGLVLIRASATEIAIAPPWRCPPQRQWHGQQQPLLVCNPATGRRVALPPEPPAFPEIGCDPEQYVLLVGEGGVSAVGRPFQVLKAKLLLCPENPSYRRLQVQTFSSEHGAWSSPCTEIPTPTIHGGHAGWASLLKAMVVGDVVHWICVTEAGSYVVMLHVEAARVNVTPLPVSFLRGGDRHRYLLATSSAAGNPVVLVADKDKISAWDWKRSKRRSQVVVIENETILRFKGVAELVGAERTTARCVPELLWFGERSGVVLLRIHGCCVLWLDLHSKKIVRCFSADRRFMFYGCPYEIHLSSWVPTFGSAVSI